MSVFSLSPPKRLSENRASAQKRRGVEGQILTFDAGTREGEKEDDSGEREADGGADVFDAA